MHEAKGQRLFRQCSPSVGFAKQVNSWLHEFRARLQSSRDNVYRTQSVYLTRWEHMWEKYIFIKSNSFLNWFKSLVSAHKYSLTWPISQLGVETDAMSQAVHESQMLPWQETAYLNQDRLKEVQSHMLRAVIQKKKKDQQCAFNNLSVLSQHCVPLKCALQPPHEPKWAQENPNCSKRNIVLNYLYNQILKDFWQQTNQNLLCDFFLSEIKCIL